MKKKLQVYISSTFYDLIEERHATVQAVLHTGHIPAGTEQFFKESRIELLKKWIDESDVYVLILGGFYGLTLPDESKSYTHWEYDYAGEIGKPRIALVVTDDALRQKPYDFTQIEHYEKYQQFKQTVFDDTPVFHIEHEQHIKMVIYEKMREFAGRYDLYGWFSGKDMPEVQRLLEEKASLLSENAKLHAELEQNKNSEK